MKARIVQKKARIVQAADALAYLPLYRAEEKNLRLDLGNGEELKWGDAFETTERTPPARYFEGLGEVMNRTGDIGCLNVIRLAGKEERLIGICDPIEITDRKFEDLVMVAGFIRRACFWCLTDLETSAKAARSLDVDRLFIHDASFATGNALGSHLHHHRDGRARRQPITGAFELLVDGAVSLRENGGDLRIAAISASILSCEIARVKGFKIAYPLTDVAPYDPFLSTGIVVHRQALEDQEFRLQLSLLLLAIREALRDLQTGEIPGSETILKLCTAEGRFREERLIDCARVEGNLVVPKNAGPHSQADISLGQATEIYRWLVSAKLYSLDGKVAHAEWANAHRVRDSASIPLLSDYFDGRALREAKRYRLAGVDPPPPSGLAGLITGVVLAVALAFTAIIWRDAPRWLVLPGLGVALLVALARPLLRLVHWIGDLPALRGTAAGFALVIFWAGPAAELVLHALAFLVGVEESNDEKVAKAVKVGKAVPPVTRWFELSEPLHSIGEFVHKNELTVHFWLGVYILVTMVLASRTAGARNTITRVYRWLGLRPPFDEGSHGP